MRAISIGVRDLSGLHHTVIVVCYGREACRVDHCNRKEPVCIQPDDRLAAKRILDADHEAVPLGRSRVVKVEPLPLDIEIVPVVVTTGTVLLATVAGVTTEAGWCAGR